MAKKKSKTPTDSAESPVAPSVQAVKPKAKAKAKSKAEDASSAGTAKRPRKRVSSEAPPPGGEDLMSQAVVLCQEQRWREAASIFRRMCDRADSDGNMDLYVSLSAARLKVEYSLRRQMVASLTEAAKTVLAKEYLLDVG